MRAWKKINWTLVFGVLWILVATVGCGGNPQPKGPLVSGTLAGGPLTNPLPGTPLTSLPPQAQNQAMYTAASALSAARSASVTNPITTIYSTIGNGLTPQTSQPNPTLPSAGLAYLTGGLISNPNPNSALQSLVALNYQDSNVGPVSLIAIASYPLSSTQVLNSTDQVLLLWGQTQDGRDMLLEDPVNPNNPSIQSFVISASSNSLYVMQTTINLNGAGLTNLPPQNYMGGGYPH